MAYVYCGGTCFLLPTIIGMLLVMLRYGSLTTCCKLYHGKCYFFSHGPCFVALYPGTWFIDFFHTALILYIVLSIQRPTDGSRFLGLSCGCVPRLACFLHLLYILHVSDRRYYSSYLLSVVDTLDRSRVVYFLPLLCSRRSTFIYRCDEIYGTPRIPISISL